MKKALTFVLIIFTAALTAIALSTGQQADAGNSLSGSFRSAEESRTIEIYSRAKESVVFISTTTKTIDPFDPFVPYQELKGSGSGVIVDANQGIVLTNLHVIQEAHKVEILLADGSSYDAKLVGLDPEIDVAVLRFASTPPGLRSLEFGDSSKLAVGQRVLAIGNPHGLNMTLTAGIVSSLDRTVRNPNGFLMKGLVQTDAAINPGNSGGPLLDMNGRLVGINSAILSKSGDSAGIGFAVPANQIRTILPEVISTGRVLRPNIGWILVDTTQGPMVRRVQQGGPAERAGINPIERPVDRVFVQGYVRDFKRADLVYKINGRPVASAEQVQDIVRQDARNGVISITLRRGGAQGVEREVKVEPVFE